MTTACLVLACCAVGRAQTDSQQEAPDQAVERAEADIYYVEDKDGNLQPVVNFTLERFDRLLEMERLGAALQRPLFTLQRLSATGSAQDDHAELTIVLELVGSDPGWVRVPLRLGGVVLTGPASYGGQGEFFVEFDEAGHEYVAWFRGEVEQPHRLTLRVLAPIEQSAGQHLLKLNAPRAVNSELTLKVPLPTAVPQVSSGAVLQSATPVDGSTEFKVLGLMSDFAIQWRPADAPVAQVAAVLEATGSLLVHIDGSGVRTEAEFRVKSRAGKFGDFRVRLPKGATLGEHEQTEYTLSAISEPENAAGGGRLFEVRKRQPSAEAVVLRLVTEQARRPGPDETIELAGFDVLGAVRQGGHVAVDIAADWQATFGEGQAVRQIELEELPSELRRGDLSAAFEYFGQPHSLPARILPRRTTVSVEPRWVVQVEADRLLLSANLKYHVAGGRLFSLPIELAGWQIDPADIGPADLVDPQGIVSPQTGPLVIALSQPAADDIELTFQAQRKLDGRAIDFALPWPQASVRGAAELIVQPADNIELSVQPDKLVALSPLPAARPKTGSFEQPPWNYQAQDATARFAGTFDVLPGRVTVQAHSVVTLDTTGGQVDQRLLYTIQREPLAVLALDVPSALAEAGQVRLFSGDQPLAFDPQIEQSGRQGMVRMRVPLNDNETNDFELRIAYPLSGGQPIPRASVPLKVPLIMPADGELSANELEVIARPGVQVQLLDDHWQAAKGTSPTPAAGLKASASQARSGAVLQVQLEDRDRLDSTVVERAWIQTWFADESRSDRAVYRFVSRGRQLAISLPPDAIGVHFALDEQTIVPRLGRTADQWIVSLPADRQGPSRHVLEVHYRFQDRAGRNSRSAIALPRLDDSIAVRRLYWQLVLPSGEHLLSGPARLTSEFDWAWEDFYWGRRPLLEQPELEAWSHAAPQSVLPQGANRYLFSGQQFPPTLHVTLVSRSLLVLGASGLVLLVGLVVLYVPAVRHAGLFLVAALAIAVGGLLAPETTLVLLEAAVFGLLLALLAGALEHRVARRGRRSLILRGQTSSIARRGSSITQPRPAPISTETAAVPMEMSAQEPAP